MIENKNSEDGFREQFELCKLRLKEEDRKRVGKHKENVGAMGDKSAELQAYVRQHFDQQRTLLNCKGEKKSCYWECHSINNNQHVLS